METFALTVVEETRLAELETLIARGMATFVEVGMALLEIRDTRLYRREYSTFEGYCRERWGMTRQHANRTIAAAEVARVLEPIGSIPQIESQARPLAALPPAQQAEAWQRAVETAPDGRITAAHVQAVVDDLRRGPASQPVQVTIFSHESVDYYTPRPYIDAARAVMGNIDLDPASCTAAQEWIRAGTFYGVEEDGLQRPWFGRVWLNPPYSKTGAESNQAIWSQRLVAEYTAGHVSEAVLLVKAALGYKWFDDLWYTWPVCFARERISFIRPDGSDDGQSKQGTAFLYFGPNAIRFREVFGMIGRVILPAEGYYVNVNAL